jgi:GDPmannose 4,6-dehydratase
LKKKIALITGITGQDGSYLAEFLLKKNYTVHGIRRRSSSINTERIDHLHNDNKILGKKLFLHYGDLVDPLSIEKIIKAVLPDEIYNLAAQSHVKISFDMPEYTSNVNGLGTLRILEIIKNLKQLKKIKFYQASSSEIFGDSNFIKKNEITPFFPKSPYASSKLFAHWITKNYRDSYKMFCSNGILFNHESPRRGVNFVTKKITSTLSRIAIGLERILEIGNLDSKRDWGHARDYVEMMWKIMQLKKSDDYVIATEKQYSVKKFIELTCKRIGFEIIWYGKNLRVIGKVSKIHNKKLKLKKNQIVVKVNERFFRPNDVDNLLGDSSKAKKILKWKPKKDINLLINEMVEYDLIKANNELLLKNNLS